MDYFETAVRLCSGRGLEIGALSNPAPLKGDVIYADTCTKAAMTSILCSLEGGPYYDLEKLIEPGLILQPPHYFLPIANAELDFIYSSHALEHTPNLLAAIYDQLRCVKAGGVVYFVVPNRRGTYDHRRPATPASTLVRRFEERSFTFSDEDASELLWGTTGHAHYEQKTPKKLAEIHSDGSGAHHFVVFTPASTPGIAPVRYPAVQLRADLLFRMRAGQYSRVPEEIGGFSGLTEIRYGSFKPRETGVKSKKGLVGAAGLEPATLSLEG